jgi:hypothetical protein
MYWRIAGVRFGDSGALDVEDDCDTGLKKLAMSMTDSFAPEAR